MTRTLVFSALTMLTLTVTSCKDKKANRAVCQKAQDRYLICVKEVLGQGMYDIANSPGKKKQGLESCTNDDATVEMYKKCLPRKDCKGFMDCVMSLGEK